jgi:hypothetical protein
MNSVPRKPRVKLFFNTSQPPPDLSFLRMLLRPPRLLSLSEPLQGKTLSSHTSTSALPLLWMFGSTHVSAAQNRRTMFLYRRIPHTRQSLSIRLPSSILGLRSPSPRPSSSKHSPRPFALLHTRPSPAYKRNFRATSGWMNIRVIASQRFSTTKSGFAPDNGKLEPQSYVIALP